MTTNQIKKTVQALTETKALLNKELSYRKDLQKKDMVEFYSSHILKLEKMLSDSWNAIS